MSFAPTPDPPYVAVVFTSVRTAPALDAPDAPDASDGDQGYAVMSRRMEELAAAQPGYLGIESARDGDGRGITVSYWTDEAAAAAWKQVAEHLVAQERGRSAWYAGYRVRVATVTRDYGMG